MREYKVLKILNNFMIIFVFAILFILLNKSPIEATVANCAASGLYCIEPGSYVEGYWYFVKVDEDSGIRVCAPSGAGRREYDCTKDPDDSHCVCDGAVCGVNAYATEAACKADIGAGYRGTGGVGCCSSTRPCTPGCTPSCPEGTTGTDYDLGTVGADCRDDCGDLHTRTCYCIEAQCSDLSDLASWTETACSGDNCRIYDGNVPIPNNHEDCPDEQQKVCYVANNHKPEPPTGDDVTITPGDWTTISSQAQILEKSTTLAKILNIFIPTTQAQTPHLQEILGFTSTTHTGEVINNPVKVEAKYRDADGNDDLVALYFWASISDDSDARPPMGDSIVTETATINTQKDFGFMVLRDQDTGQWDKVYVPRSYDQYTTEPAQCVPNSDGTYKCFSNTGSSIVSDCLFCKNSVIIEHRDWVEAGTVGNSEPIIVEGQHPDTGDMVRLYDIQATDSPSENDLTTLTFYMGFDTLNDIILSGEYKITTLVDDKVSWTNNDVDWTYSNKNWSVDEVNPNEADISVTTDGVDESNISIHITAEDDLELGPIRLDACRKGGTQTDYIYIGSQGGRQYEMEDCDTVNFGGATPEDIHMDQGNSLLSNDIVNPSNSSYTPTLTDIALGLNEGGSITFYLTVMDEGGNWIQDTYIYRLGEWAVVKNGLVFGSTGVTSATRVFENDNVWQDAGQQKLEDYGFTESTVDLTDTALLGGESSYTSFLGFLERYMDNQTFKAASYPGIPISSAYIELMEAYSYKSYNLNDELNNIDKNIGGNISSYCAAGIDYCVISNIDDITINKGTTCDTKALISSKKDIIITPDFLNENEDDACILVAGGDIVIKNGDDLVGNIEYDTIEAFMVADNQIVIEGLDNSDGLRVEGGLVSFTKGSSYGSIENNRVMEPLHIRSMYPVIAIKNSAKYGMLSKSLFGSQIDIFKIEVGFKPY
jgi:hypothetical protein